jgi:hypothetical protein
MHKSRVLSLVIGLSLAFAACNQSVPILSPNLEVTPGLPTPWKNQDVGQPGQLAAPASAVTCSR